MVGIKRGHSVRATRWIDIWSFRLYELSFSTSQALYIRLAKFFHDQIKVKHISNLKSSKLALCDTVCWDSHVQSHLSQNLLYGTPIFAKPP